MHGHVRNALLVPSEYSKDSWCLDCDQFYSNLSNIRYALIGGRLGRGEPCGPFYVDVCGAPTHTSWSVGACIVITSGTIRMVG